MFAGAGRGADPGSTLGSGSSSRVVQGVGSLIRLRIPGCLRMRGRRGVALLVGRRQGLVRGRRRMRV